MIRHAAITLSLLLAGGLTAEDSEASLLARAAVLEGDWESARLEAELHLASMVGGDAEIQLIRAEALLRLEEPEQAVELLRSVIDTELETADQVHALRLLAQGYDFLGAPAAAEAIRTRLAEEYPDSWEGAEAEATLEGSKPSAWSGALRLMAGHDSNPLRLTDVPATDPANRRQALQDLAALDRIRLRDLRNLARQLASEEPIESDRYLEVDAELAWQSQNLRLSLDLSLIDYASNDHLDYSTIGLGMESDFAAGSDDWVDFTIAPELSFLSYEAYAFEVQVEAGWRRWIHDDWQLRIAAFLTPRRHLSEEDEVFDGFDYGLSTQVTWYGADGSLLSYIWLSAEAGEQRAKEAGLGWQSVELALGTDLRPTPWLRFTPWLSWEYRRFDEVAEDDEDRRRERLLELGLEAGLRLTPHLELQIEGGWEALDSNRPDLEYRRWQVALGAEFHF
jgi:hypothetical protein